MPLIPCADCGRQISDAAPHCIGCGRPRAANLGLPTVGPANLPPMGHAAPSPASVYTEPVVPSYASAPASGYAAAPGPVFAPAQPYRAREFRFAVPRLSFKDHWVRGKLYVGFMYLQAVFLLLAGLMVMSDGGGGGWMLMMWVLAGLSFWLADAVSNFKESGLWWALILQGLGLVGGIFQALGAEDSTQVQMVAFWMGVNLVFTTYFYERRKEFVN